MAEPDNQSIQSNPPAHLKWLRYIISLGALVVAVVHLTCQVLAIDAVTLALVVIAILPWIAPLVKSVELPGGLKVELRELVKREVSKTTAETLRRVTTLDRKLIEYWERESLLKHQDSEPKLRSLEENVEQLERDLSDAPEPDKPHLGFALREMYWAYLKHARDHYASSEPYQKIRQRVIEGLSKLGQL